MLSNPLSHVSFSNAILLFFFNDTATTEIYTLSLHDALPISYGKEKVYGLIPQGARRSEEYFESNSKHTRSEEHTSELQSRQYLVCRLLLETLTSFFKKLPV